MAWILIGQPRSLWHSRRWLLSLPLGIASAALIMIYLTVSQWESDQKLHAFRLKAQQAGEMLQQQFSEHERMLLTLATLFSQRQSLSSPEFSTIARSYLDDRPELRAMAWMPRIGEAERPGFEKWAQHHVAADFSIRQAGSGITQAASGNLPYYYPVTYMEPLSDNEQVLGIDIGSEPRRASAIAQAIGDGRPSATEPIMLFDNKGKGILLTQAIYSKSKDVQSPPIGILSVTLQMETYLHHTFKQANLFNSLAKLEDITQPDKSQLLFDEFGEEVQRASFERHLELGGRHYLLTLVPNANYLAMHRGWQSWVTLAGGLMLTSLLGAFLLLMSGQRQQMEHVVQDRTRDLQEREAKLSAILDQAADAILTLDHRGIIVSVNRAAGTLFGYPLPAMQGMAFSQLLAPSGTENSVHILKRLAQQQQGNEVLFGQYANSQSFPLSVSVSLVKVANETFFVCILHDLTEQHLAQKKIHHLAHHDSLTGLANRFTLDQRLQEMLKEAENQQDKLALLFIDLDHFKKINDSLGHHAGDQLLVKASQRLQQLMPDAALIARLSNDEFVTVFTGHAAVENIPTLAHNILTALREPFEINGDRLQSGASIGISRFPDDGRDPDTLLRNADAAVMAAKQQGRGRFQLFTAALNAAAQERLQMESRIWLGLERREFELYLQPQMHLSSRRIIGAEALLRWRHPELGFIPPDRFIPIAEESGLILPLGEWVLERGMHILADWQKRKLPMLRLAINLSARQCSSGTLLASLDRLQATTQVDLQWLEIEITETAAMQDPEQTRDLLRQLRARGIKVAIDDFGTGYSSLSYLKLFEIDRIKIDRSFVKDIENDENDAVIASATIALAHTLGLEVLAEGIETEGQCAFLNHELCDEGQGYLFGKPVPLAEFEAMLPAPESQNLLAYA